ncbi:MAG TPA: TetR/AcrR family transcriptional regulator [Solirubrobacteraceae bacterium]|jgi:AcrR family transcriptional regulator
MSITQTKMGRPLTSRGQVTRERIVSAAAAEIFARGVTATTLEHIKAAAEVSSSQLYHYFKDKDALVLAVIEHQAQAVLDGQEPELSHLDSLESLRAWRNRLVAGQRLARCGGCPLGSLSGQVSETMPGARLELAGGFNRWDTAIRHGLSAMHRRGELVESADPERLATATLAAVQGGLLLTQVTGNTAPLEAALDEMIAHIAALTTTPSAAAP